MKTIKLYLNSSITKVLKTHTTRSGEVIKLESTRTVPVPSKKNQQTPVVNPKTGRAFIKQSDQYVKWKTLTRAFWEAQAWKIAASGARMPIFRCKVVIMFYFHDEKDRDCTNKAETIMDALVQHKILADDSFKVVSEVSLKGFMCRNKPRTEIYITILDPGDPGYEYDVTDLAEMAKIKKQRSSNRYHFRKKSCQ